MNEKLTFKEYLHSKERLREAVQNTPERTASYTISKYCKIAIGETKKDKDYVSLKPKQKVEVDWLYEDLNNPSVVSVRFYEVDGIKNGSEFSILWGHHRLEKWLQKNTRETF